MGSARAGPATAFDIPTGVQYAMEVFRHSFPVTDGHLNRVLWVTLDGEVSEFIAFGNIVPTGLTVRGNTVFMAQAGPAPHAPADGKIVTFGPKSPAAELGGIVEIDARLAVVGDRKRGESRPDGLEVVSHSVPPHFSR